MGGVDKLAGSEYPSAEAFWEYVRAQLVVLPRQKRSFPTKDALREVRLQNPKLSGSEEVDLHSLVNGGLDVDPTLAAARGAVLYARWRQEAPFGCVERDECEEERQRERQGKSPRVIDDEL
ncbi:uncharacterized protein ASPGLDRAFT_38071 [Aspergillus glaucus CBS 516.65]|uniref:Uncharacterized protein n=1 Tax=Aspergillus glaucus CBS 516.65 TaxID=1160497 RepID=A0A1L9VBK4_ASPGL|nr:hypothetical protein ASPGLDRAFT_38071 [Aspergillus glaucus CBS 516.65]OJJ81280.1 hypothetical protein ASPGLDRAFT_38071 [Aspergillus glaucus CBS 516.65]